jgi:branched-chain amino acid aminotransferase
MTISDRPEEVTPIAWVNGKIVPFATAGLPLSDLGVVAGASITELARTFRHQPFRLEQHLQRLLDSVQELGFPVRFSQNDLLTAAKGVVESNRRLVSPESDLGIVIFVTAGSHSTYLKGRHSGDGTAAVHTFELPFTLWRSSVTEGVRLRISSYRQIPSDSLPVHLKVRNRLHWWLADHEVSLKEPGSRALLLNHSDQITETSTSCFFAVIDGEIVTPDHDVLNSMTCRVVEELAERLGMRFRRGPVHRDQIPDFSEAFLSSTPVGLLPVRSIDEHVLNHGVPGPVYQKLTAEFSRLVGIDIRNQILTQD